MFRHHRRYRNHVRTGIRTDDADHARVQQLKHRITRTGDIAAVIKRDQLNLLTENSVRAVHFIDRHLHGVDRRGAEAGVRAGHFQITADRQ